MKVRVVAEYFAATGSLVDIPDIKSWKDIKDWYIKWNTFYYTLDGVGEYKEISLDELPEIDMKRPEHARIETEDYSDLLDEF